MRSLLVVAALAACGGGGPKGSSVGPPSPATPADPAAMRALLAKYSPSGHAIVTTLEGLPDKVVMGDGWEVELTPSIRFDDYLTSGAPENTVQHISTGVHETTHAYMTWVAFKLVADAGGKWGAGSLAIPADGDPFVVPITALYVTAEMDATFPADAKTFRYGEYVTPDDPRLGSNTYGVYGLLDELAAYYQDSKTTLDLWPWVRDEAPAENRILLNYLVLLDDLPTALAEFDLYILHYLVHAKEHQPEVYDAIVANEAFRAAYLAVRDGYVALAARAAELEATVYDVATRRGMNVVKEGGRIVLDGHPLSSDDLAPEAAVRAYGDAEPYAAMRESLRQ